MSRARVAIIGGGLAGLATATVLANTTCQVTLFESRRQLGGRAASFREPHSDELTDFCQHVGMGCCTYLQDFLQRHQLDQHFRRERRLLFIGPQGERCRFEAVDWLPAPLHLGPAFLRLRYLTWRERGRLATALLKLARTTMAEGREVFSHWLVRHGQTERCVALFWRAVLESALGDSLDNVSTAAARQVFVTGFMAHRQVYEVLLPQLPLSELFDQRAAAQLAESGVQILRGAAVQQIHGHHAPQLTVVTATGEQHFDRVILAVPWRAVRAVLADDLHSHLSWLPAVERFPTSPITGLHLWFDRPINRDPHAVIVGRVSQWLFAKGAELQSPSPATNDQVNAHYYQVVISASRLVQQQDRTAVVNQVLRELGAIWPAARQAKLLRHRLVTEPHAVFARNAQTEANRPDAATPIAGLFVAGDWTNTGWPATMEGAVRSGYRAARAVLKSTGEAPPPWSRVPDLPRGWLARFICGPH